MNIQDLKASLPYLFKAQVTPFIWGHAGIGKTTVLKQYAKEANYRFFSLYLGTQSDIGDVLGLQEFVRDENGKAVSTSFASPEWMVSLIDYCNANPKSGAILFLDEFNRARRDILSGMFSLALDKTFHTLKLPSNCHVVAAGNPPTDEYTVTDVDDTALMARFAHIKLEPSFLEWETYAKNSGFEPTIVSFLKEQPELLEDSRSTFALPIKVDRRAWERCDRLFQVETPPHLMEQLMTGIVGTERMVAYKLHCKAVDRPLTGTQILAGEGLDLIKKWSDPKDTKSSYVTTTADNVVSAILETGLKEAQYEAFVAFLNAVPKETFYTLMRKLLDTQNESYMKFIKDDKYNESLTVIAKEARGIVDSKEKRKQEDVG